MGGKTEENPKFSSLPPMGGKTDLVSLRAATRFAECAGMIAEGSAGAAVCSNGVTPLQATTPGLVEFGPSSRGASARTHGPTNPGERDQAAQVQFELLAGRDGIRLLLVDPLQQATALWAEAGRISQAMLEPLRERVIV